MTRAVASILAVISCLLALRADASAQGRDAVVRVGVAGSVPFVVPPAEGGDGLPRGLSVDVWREIAARNGWRCVYRRVDTTAALLALVEAGEIDVAVGPTSITAERARRVAFSQPYQDASLGILSRADRGYLSRVRPFLSRSFAALLTTFTLLLLAVGTLIWLAERRRNAQQFPGGAAGVGNGVWLALVTMTTVGYGDRAPVTVAGRVITGIWMVAALVLTSSLTASLTTALTLSQLDDEQLSSASDLRGRRVATVRGTTSEAFLARHHASPLLVARLEDALSALSRRRVEAVVFDRPMLQYVLHARGDGTLRLSEASYEPQGYGFAMALRSPLRQPIDIALLSMHQSGEVGAINARWLGH